MRYHLLAVLLLLPIAANAETPLSLKGIQMGDSREKVDQTLGEPVQCLNDGKIETYRYCLYSGMTFAGDYGVEASAIFFQGQVYSIEFDFKWDAENRLNLVAEKYGRPRVCTYSNECHLTVERLPLRLTSRWSGGADGSVSLRDHDVYRRVEEIRNPPGMLDKDDI